MNKFEFSFERAVVFEKMKRSSDGNVEIKTTFHHSMLFCIPEKNVRYLTTRYLKDTSTIVVDFGPSGRNSNRAIIAAGRKANLPVL